MLAGITITAADIGWSAGAGAELSGRARDLVPLDFSHQLRVATLALDRTDAGHIGGAAGGGAEFASDTSGRYAVRPRGNSVTHEDEMMKVAGNQLDYEAVTSLYTRSLALIKLAIGKA